MIDHPLAKELWDADYPFRRRGKQYQAVCLCKELVCNGMFGREFLFEEARYPEPTLSELIEACGDNLHYIGRFDNGIRLDGWVCVGTAKYIDSFGTRFLGSTPEEAVARLWLALNKK